ncbi:hypothetical protein RUA4292_03125 [Ruegeria atlantica]|uniref:Uncharacterized protein n=1 Tax=Ruegeria atlantica TaxID=81569 RepID=A0A0P1EGD2_9RHOB|nr:hypothetical protein RUA4292_03125 [Ruegeria atlantica]
MIFCLLTFLHGMLVGKFCKLCGARKHGFLYLGKVREIQRVGGLRTEQASIEVWVSQERSSFSDLITRLDGISSFVAAGTYSFTIDTPEEKIGIPL